MAQRKRSAPTGGSLSDVLIAFVEAPSYRPMPQRELMHRLHVRPQQRAELRRLIRALVDDGRLIEDRGGRLAVATTTEPPVAGRLTRHRDGFGFVLAEGGRAEDVFIPRHALGDALSGDRVEARVTGRSREGKLHGVVARVLEARGRLVLGLFQARGPGGIVQPFDPALGGEPIRIPGAFRHDAQDRHAVYVEVVRAPEDGAPAEGKVLEVLGHLDAPGTDVAIVMRRHGLETGFPAAVLAEARRLPDRVPTRDAADRERFDDPAPVTIDGETARDFDDAIAIRERDGGGFRLWVHIADVAHFVPEGGVLDVEARARGTSVYFPDRVLPMFPEELSANLCSLRPDEDRLVQTVVLDIEADGRVSAVRFADGVIRSAARLTYTQVAALLGQPRGRLGPPGVAPMLRAADRLRRALEERRRLRGSIDFDLPEPELVFDVEGALTSIAMRPRNVAHRLIEECMLAANEAVARQLDQPAGGCTFRIHEAPDPAKIGMLSLFLETLGIELRPGAEGVTPRDLQQLLERCENLPEGRVIAQLTLRAMKQARYSASNKGHFGLASGCYCHFTSPIRRYPDLLVHRRLRAVRHGRARSLDLQQHESLELAGARCSELERRAEAAERELLSWKKVAYIAERVGEEFDGLITGVARFGLFVQLEENLVEGLLRTELLGEERFELVEARQELRGERSGRSFRLGDRVRVRVERADRVLQRVDFVLVEGPARAGRRPLRPARRAAGAQRPAGRRGVHTPGGRRKRRV